MRPLSLVLVMSVVAIPTLAQDMVVTFRPSPNGFTGFSMPSGNVECIFTPAGGSGVYRPADGGPELSCDRREPTYVNLTMTPNRIARTHNPGEQACCSADNPLPFGKSWAMGAFICDSTQAGLTCRRTDGHGFSIGRAAIKPF